MKVNEVAKLTGMSVRALQYYDTIGLLSPRREADNGYRDYGRDELERLQQIMLLRELAFPLEDVRRIIDEPGFDRAKALVRHRELLTQKRDRLDALIRLIEEMMKGETTLSFKAFDTKGIEESKKKYAAEVKERWGDTEAYRVSQERTSQYTDKQWEAFNGEGAELMRAFAEARTLAPDSEAAEGLVKQWQDFITRRFYPCTDAILAGLGAMYAGDERFTQYIDQYGEGTARFMSSAIEKYCSKRI